MKALLQKIRERIQALYEYFFGTKEKTIFWLFMLYTHVYVGLIWIEFLGHHIANLLGKTYENGMFQIAGEFRGMYLLLMGGYIAYIKTSRFKTGIKTGHFPIYYLVVAWSLTTLLMLILSSIEPIFDFPFIMPKDLISVTRDVLIGFGVAEGIEWFAEKNDDNKKASGNT